MDETSPLLVNERRGSETPVYEFRDPEIPPEDVGNSDQKASSPPVSVSAILSLLLIGVFVSQADTSLFLATYGEISSEFDALESGSWLLSSYMLAMCVSQPLYGKLSDIFGRKALLQTAYILFSVGTLITGLGTTLTWVIIGRSIQGLGGAGMVCMVSILIVDIVPIREVAAYRSYVNVIQTLGRSCGGVVGGFLTEKIGWRWTILSQLGLTICSIILVWLKLEESKRTDYTNKDKPTLLTSLKRIDFLGALFLSLSIFGLLLSMELAFEAKGSSRLVLISVIVATVVAAILFILVEKYWAKEPIFPLQLLTSYVVVTSYSILTIQNAVQTSLMFIIPMYFQITQKASTGVAGAYMIPSIVGNTIGGISAGYWIKRSGRYKIPTIVASLASISAFTLLIAFWRGQTTIFQSLFVFPGGFATGVAHSAVFIGLTSGIGEDQSAIASSGLYLMGNIGGVSGLSGTSAVFQAFLRSTLKNKLRNVPNAEKILEKALSNIEYVFTLKGHIRELVVESYVAGFQKVFLIGLGLSTLSFLISIITREKQLSH